MAFLFNLYQRYCIVFVCRKNCCLYCRDLIIAVHRGIQSKNEQAASYSTTGGFQRLKKRLTETNNKCIQGVRKVTIQFHCIICNSFCYHIVLLYYTVFNIYFFYRPI